MKKILLSISSIIFAVAILAGGTGAFLNRPNTSTGNTFATGIIDLKIDNESYVTNENGILTFSPSTSWSLSNLAGKLFFNFLDIKPGDIGEDTISLHVNNNNAWACMNIDLTGTPENGQPEPEVAVDPTAGVNDGELQNNLYFTFWADDGDNVYEKGEKVFKQGLVKDIWNGDNWALADSQTNVWSGSGPILANTVKYIGKAWCFGDMTPTPVNQDGKGKTGTNGPLSRGTGFSCTGVNVGNIVQSDGVKADVSFTVAQSRNNSEFTCAGGNNNPPPPNISTLFSDNFNTCNHGDNEEKDKNSDKKWSHFGREDNQSDYQCSFSSWHGGKGDSDKEDSNSQCKIGTLVAGHKDHGQDHKESITTPSINTVGYHTITLKYDRKTDDTDSPPNPLGPQTLTVEYSVNGGTTWTTLETVTGESPWTTKTFSLSPSADNKTNVKVRFTLVGQNSTNKAYIDNIVVTGVNP